MDYAEISVDHKYHPHIIGKNGANGRCDISSLPNTLLLRAPLCIRPPHVFANLLQGNLNVTNPLRLGQRLLRVFCLQIQAHAYCIMNEKFSILHKAELRKISKSKPFEHGTVFMCYCR